MTISCDVAEIGVHSLRGGVWQSLWPNGSDCQVCAFVNLDITLQVVIVSVKVVSFLVLRMLSIVAV